MFVEHLSLNSLGLPRAAFGRLWRPAQGVCEQHPEGCPADTLRAALARESSLLQQKEILLKEQEILRAESDHRLLNGLQMVVSLLSLQSRTATTPEVAMQLSVAASRVATIERVHRRLHFNDGTTTVELKKSLEELCQDASGMAGSGDASQLDIRVSGSEITIPSATAISLGFIANELITNAVKYGIGEITVSLDAGPDGGYALSICNGGPALPDDFDPAASKGLGMKIVRSLVKQIGGTFSFARGADNQGARFVVHFA